MYNAKRPLAVRPCEESGRRRRRRHRNCPVCNSWKGLQKATKIGMALQRKFIGKGDLKTGGRQRFTAAMLGGKNAK